MKIPMTLLLIVTLILTAANAGGQDIQRDMARFDQAFIPLWTYTRDGDIHQAKPAVFYLEFQWQRLRGKYRETLPDPAWRESFQRVNDWLGDAYFAVDANCPKRAFNQLEYVKYELQQLRKAYRIEYYLDNLFDFSDQVAMLSEAANDEMLCMLEWSEYEAMAKDAVRDWARIVQLPFDAERYGLTPDEEQEFRRCQTNVTSALAGFAAAVRTADREAVAAACPRLDRSFMSVLRLFGNFEEARTFYANL